MKRIFSILLALLMLAGSFAAMAIDVGEARVVIGADISEDQIRSVYNTFGIERNSVTELKVTNTEERRYLEGYVDSSVIGSRSISCVYIEILAQGSGLDISTSNLTWCSREMYVNALTTAGITDAKVIVTAPFAVSGTAALTGVYKAYEDITGEKLDELAKDVGTQELVITGDLAQQIGDIDAASIINDLKMILDETSKMTDSELREEIKRIAKDYNVTLSEGQIDQLISLCRSLEGLGPEELQKRVEAIQGTLKTLAGVQETASGIINTVKNFFSSIGDFFSNLFKKKD